MQPLILRMDIERNEHSRLVLTQYDKEVPIEIQVFQDGLPYLINDEFIKVEFTRPDGEFIIQSTGLSIQENIIRLNTYKTLCQVAGKTGKITLALEDSNGKRKGTAEATLIILSGAVGNKQERSGSVATVKEQLDKSINDCHGAVDLANTTRDQVISDINEAGEKYKDITDFQGRLNGFESSLEKIEQQKLPTYVKKVEINDLTSNKAEKTEVIALDTKVNGLRDSSPSGVYETLDALKIAHPTNDGKMYIAGTKWCYHNGTTWVEGGVYQAHVIAERSIDSSKTTFVDTIQTGVLDININEYFTITGSISSINGNLNVGNELYKSTDYLDVENSEFFFRYVLDGSIASAFNDYTGAFYDSNKTFVEGIQGGIEYLPVMHNGKYGRKYIKPQNAKYIRLCCQNDNLNGLGNQFTYLDVRKVLKEKFNTDYYESYIKNYDETVIKPRESTNWLNGLKIACFGDSIIGNFQDDTSIPSIIAQNTGTTVYNLGFGGTKMSGDNSSNSQAMYWDKFSFSRIVDCIETGDFQPMLDALPHMSSAKDYFKNTIELLKNIDFNTIDIVMWQYGTNDFTNENKIKNTEDITDIYSYYGAYCYAIEKLLTLYPHLRIVLITPTWRYWHDNGVYKYDSDTHLIANQSLIEFVECVKEIGKKYHLPVIDNYFELDINKFTKYEYFGKTDGTHLHASGRKRVGNRISHKLLTLI